MSSSGSTEQNDISRFSGRLYIKAMRRIYSLRHRVLEESSDSYSSHLHTLHLLGYRRCITSVHKSRALEYWRVVHEILHKSCARDSVQNCARDSVQSCAWDSVQNCARDSVQSLWLRFCTEYLYIQYRVSVHSVQKFWTEL